MKKALSIAGMLLLTGCGSFYKPVATAGVPCKGEQCNRVWTRAQTWIATNSAYRIQLVNDTIIQTYGPHEYSSSVAWTITKQERPTEGDSLIVLQGICNGTIYGCVFDPSVETNRLYYELQSIK